MDIFRKLGIAEYVVKAIEEEKFEKPSKIQEKSIPLVLQGKDVIAQSATGSGKTLVFGVGIIQSLQRGHGIQALVLTPTRELAEQIMLALRKFSKHKPLEITTVYGGVSINPQIDALRSADVVVGTPGRILDHMERGTINFSRVKILVLDEADRMFDMGFIDDVKKIIRVCPQKRQTLLFSATIPSEIEYIVHKYMVAPVKVLADTYVDPQKLHQVYYNMQENMKLSLLAHLLKQERTKLIMVFCNSRRTADFVARNLQRTGIDALAIHGGLSQARRSEIMQRFHAKNIYVMVCTDVAARGLDIPGVSHVYNYDIPKESKQYIHRIGRTARAGKEGIAVSLLAEQDYENFSRVLRDNSLTIKKMEIPPFERIEFKRDGFRKDYRSHSERRHQDDRYGFRGRGHSGSGQRGGSSGERGHSRYGGNRDGEDRRGEGRSQGGYGGSSGSSGRGSQGRRGRWHGRSRSE